LVGCVGFAASDQLIVSTDAGLARTNYATCASNWQGDRIDSEQAAALDPAGFRLMTWNVYKAQTESWPEDFSRLISGQDLVLLQEAHLTPRFRTALEKSRYHWSMARAFDYKGYESGVLTAGKVAPLAACLGRTAEPLIRIPKSSLVTRYPLEGSSEELWVANLHGVNFTLGTTQFRRQLKSLARVLESHSGPLILAGDFNNWSRRRSGILNAVTARLQVLHLSFTEDRRSRHLGYPVDLVFYRGVEVMETDVVEVASSDHNPVRVHFAVPGYAREGR
jgi:endonuclease/exonuclease/phosphatase (EEP) superfamily protein YafD